jgi:hypothetical protein
MAFFLTSEGGNFDITSIRRHLAVIREMIGHGRAIEWWYDVSRIGGYGV